VDDLWQAIRWAHLIAMAFFVGGQLVIGTVLLPVVRQGGDPAVMRAAGRRFGQLTVGAAVVLAGTGIAMADHFGQWNSSTLHLKLGLVALVAVLVGWHIRRPTWHWLAALALIVSLVIVWLGLTLAHG
jgi:uncharacterized membrane protein